MSLTHADWQARAANMNFDGRAFIQGAYQNAHDGKLFPTLNPANGQTLANVAWCAVKPRSSMRWVLPGKHSIKAHGPSLHHGNALAFLSALLR